MDRQLFQSKVQNEDLVFNIHIVDKINYVEFLNLTGPTVTGMILSVSEVTVEPGCPAAIRQMLAFINNGSPLPV